MDIDLCGLLVFRDLARTGSFTETGKTWNIAQPTVSAMIQRLEIAAGLVLLERAAGGARLTPAGTRFLESTREVCDAYLAFAAGMNQVARRMERQVLVGLDRSWFSQRLGQELPERDAADGVTSLRCDVENDWSHGLEAFRYDVVLASRFLRDGLSPGVQEAVIHQERGITVAWNPEFYQFDPVRFSFPDILRSSVLVPDRGSVTGFSSFLRMWCDQAYGMQPANSVEFATEKEAAAAAAAGLGVLLGPGDVMARLSGSVAGLTHVRTFEFLLPEGFTFGVYCRADETSKDVLTVAAAAGTLGRRLFAPA